MQYSTKLFSYWYVNKEDKNRNIHTDFEYTTIRYVLFITNNLSFLIIAEFKMKCLDILAQIKTGYTDTNKNWIYWHK